MSNFIVIIIIVCVFLASYTLYGEIGLILTIPFIVGCILLINSGGKNENYVR